MGVTDVLPAQNNTAKVNFFENTIGLAIQDILNSSKSTLLNTFDTNALRQVIKDKILYNETNNTYVDLAPNRIDINSISNFIINNDGKVPDPTIIKIITTTSAIINLNEKDLKLNLYKVTFPNEQQTFISTIEKTISNTINLNNLEAGTVYNAYLSKDGFIEKKIVINANSYNSPTIIDTKIVADVIPTGTGFTNISAQKTVNIEARGSQSQAISTNKSGNSVIVWQYYSIAMAKYLILARRIDNSGTPIGNEIEVFSANKSLSTANLSVILNDNNDFSVFWDVNTNSGNNEINVQKIDSLNNKVSSVVKLLSPKGTNNGTGDNNNFEVSSDFNGNLLFTWLDRVSTNTTTSNYSVKAQKFDSSFNKIGLEQTITQENGLSNDYIYQNRPDSKIFANGDMVICFTENNNIYYQKFDSNFNKIGSKIKISDNTSSTAKVQANIDLNKNGNILITWVVSQRRILFVEPEYDPSIIPGTKMYFKIFDKDNNILTDTTIPFSSFTVQGYQPFVKYDINNNFLITYVDETFALYARKYNSSGIALGNSFKVNEPFPKSVYVTGASQYFGQPVSTDNSGNYYITWLDYSMDSLNKDTIFFKKLSN